MNNMNFNYSECIKKQSNFGETTFYNICTNETNIIKWGTDDWAGVITLYLCIIILMGCLIAFVIDTIRY